MASLHTQHFLLSSLLAYHLQQISSNLAWPNTRAHNVFLILFQKRKENCHSIETHCVHHQGKALTTHNDRHLVVIPSTITSLMQKNTHSTKNAALDSQLQRGDPTTPKRRKPF